MYNSAVRAALDGFVEMTPWLWWLSITFYGIGDVLTTATTQLAGPVAEGSPVVGWAAGAYGLWGLVGLKILAFAVAYGVWRSVDHPHNVGVPLALSVLGVGLTTWNLVVIGAVFSA
jgi:hypothetical protein